MNIKDCWELILFYYIKCYREKIWSCFLSPEGAKEASQKKECSHEELNWTFEKVTIDSLLKKSSFVDELDEGEQFQDT